MGRPKGSKNKSKRPVMGNPIPAEEHDVSPVSDQAPAQDALEAPAEVAPEPAPEGSDEIAPPVMPTPARSLDEIAEEQSDTDIKKRELESEKAEVMKDYNKRIGVLDARCAELAVEYRTARHPETYDYKGGWKYIWDGRTGKLLERVALGSMIQLPLVERPADDPQPPRPTFADLVDGKVWEHDVHGFCRILAVLEDSVRVQTEDLDEDEVGIEIGRADWDADDARPREVPELEIGQAWVVDGRECIITVLDDRAACVTWSEDEEPGRVARLTFCGAMRPSAEDNAPAIPDLQEGQHWRLAAGDLVTITTVEETHAGVRWAKTGMTGSVPLDDFAGAQTASVEDIEAAYVPREEPAKKPRKRAVG